jgi:hypothetical protein
VAALRRNSREIVDAARPIRRATSSTVQPCARKSAISSRSANERYLPDCGFADGPNIAGGIPPAFLNHRAPTAWGTLAVVAASSLDKPDAIAAQNLLSSLRPATGGRPGERNGALAERSDRRFHLVIVAPHEALRRPLESTQFTGAAFTGVLANNGIAISMDGKGAWRDNVFVERLWRSVKYEEVYLRAYDSVSEARASIGRYLDFYNQRRPHSSLDGMTPDQAYFTPLPLRLAA